MRARTAATVALAAAALVGCGGGSKSVGSKSVGSSSDDVTAVRQTIRQLYQDLLNGNYDDVCQHFTGSVLAGIGGRSQCPGKFAVAMQFSGASGRDIKAELRTDLDKVDHAPVSVKGDTATVPSNGRKTQFVKQGGRWLIDSDITGS